MSHGPTRAHPIEFHHSRSLGPQSDREPVVNRDTIMCRMRRHDSIHINSTVSGKRDPNRIVNRDTTICRTAATTSSIRSHLLYMANFNCTMTLTFIGGVFLGGIIKSPPKVICDQPPLSQFKFNSTADVHSLYSGQWHGTPRHSFPHQPLTCHHLCLGNPIN